MDAALIRFNAGTLGDSVQVAGLIRDADASAHRPVCTHGVAQQIANHHPRQLFAGVVLAQILINQGKTDPSVIVIGVDDRKRGVNHIGSGENGVCGAPRLDAPFGNGVARRQQLEFLIGVAHLKPGTLGARAHGSLERLLNGVLNDEHHGLKARTAGIIKAVIQNGLAVWSDCFDLF